MQDHIKPVRQVRKSLSFPRSNSLRKTFPTKLSVQLGFGPTPPHECERKRCQWHGVLEHVDPPPSCSGCASPREEAERSPGEGCRGCRVVKGDQEATLERPWSQGWPKHPCDMLVHVLILFIGISSQTSSVHSLSSWISLSWTRAIGLGQSNLRRLLPSSSVRLLTSLEFGQKKRTMNLAESIRIHGGIQTEAD